MQSPCNTDDAISVSVIINNYNYAAYLQPCIESVLAQAYEPKEVLVVDDGSTDDSRAIIERYSGKVTPLFKENGGQVSACNYGIARCTGDVIVIVDADDCLSPGALAHLAAPMQKDSNVSRVQGFLQCVDRQGHPTGERVPGRPPGEGCLRARTLRTGPGSYVGTPTTGNAWARSFIDRVTPLPDHAGGANAVDTYLAAAAPLYGKVIAVDQVVGHYRLHGSNASQQRSHMRPDSMMEAVQRYRSYARFLRRAAGDLGEEIAPRAWEKRNWRILTVLFLLDHFEGYEVAAPSFFQHVMAPLLGEGPLHRRVAAMALVALLRGLPHPLRMQLARRVIHLRYI